MKLWSHDDKRSWWEPIAAQEIADKPGSPLARQLENFVDVIRGDAEPLVSGREGLESLRVVEAIKTAAASGETVALGAGA